MVFFPKVGIIDDFLSQTKFIEGKHQHSQTC